MKSLALFIRLISISFATAQKGPTWVSTQSTSQMNHLTVAFLVPSKHASVPEIHLQGQVAPTPFLDRTSELSKILFTKSPATPRLSVLLLGHLEASVICSVKVASFGNKIFFLCTFLTFTTQLNFSQAGFYI